MSDRSATGRFQRLHDIMAGHVERGDVPGLVILVSRRDEVQVGAIGTRAAGGRDPMRRDTMFRILSMTKPIVAAATMILVDEQELRLDQPVDPLLPELAHRRVLNRLDGPLADTAPANRSITVRDLLTMRMGMGIIMEPSADFPIQQALDEQRLLTGTPKSSTPHSPDEWMRRLGTLPLMHQPGERWMYHTGFDVLGVLIARVSGQPLEAFLRERLFEPLGMKDTGFAVPADERDRLAGTCRVDSEAGALEPDDDAASGPVRDSVSHAPAFPSGSGGLVSTVDDYLAFGRMMLNRGRHGSERILSEASVAAMTTDQIAPAQKARSPFFPGFWDTRGWGFGLSISTGPDAVTAKPGRYGWDGGYGTSWATDPMAHSVGEGMVAILMIQRSFDSVVAGIHSDFWTAVYQAAGDR